VAGWTRDDVREACLSVAATGCLFGHPPQDDPDAFAARIDRPFVDSGGERVLLRDWGLVTAHFARSAAGPPWRWWALDVRPRLPEPLVWDELAAELAARGFGAEAAVPDPGGDLVVHRLPASGATARSAGPDGLGTVLRAGQLYDVAVNRDPLPMPARERWAPLRDVLRALAPQGPAAWAAWLDDAAPDWAALLLALRMLHADQPARDGEWAAFGVWLLDQAQLRRVWPPWEWAYRRARFVADHPGVVPADEVAADCLDAIPMPPESATAVVDWRRARPGNVRLARMTRALLPFAAV
jgi:hypothetical protein